MPRLIWSASALRDVERVYRFLVDKDRDAAKPAVKAIRAGVTVIGRHPEIGRPFGEMNPEYREWLIAFGDSGYVVLYHYDGHVPLIVAVRHQREAGYV